MFEATTIWDDLDDNEGNTAHIDLHGLSPHEVDEVILNDSIAESISRTTGRPCKFGWTSTGRYIMAVYDVVHHDPRMIYPITAYDVPEPKGGR